MLDARDRRVARADLGVSPASRSDLDAEVAALAQVGTREWTHLEVPRVLSRTSWDDIDVLVTSTLRAPLWQGGARRRAEPPVEAMGELSTAWAEPAVRLEEMGWMRRQQDLVDMLRSRTARQRFGAVVDRLLHDARRTTWPVGAWHGDWTAHHMARRGPQVQVWGWTRFETGVPMGLDPCHFLVSAATDRDGFTRRRCAPGWPRRCGASTARVPRCSGRSTCSRSPAASWCSPRAPVATASPSAPRCC